MPGYSKPVDTIEKLKLQISSRINNNKKTDSFISSRAIPSPNLSPSNRPLIVGSAELCFPPLSPRRQLALTRSSAPPSSNRNSTSQRRQFHLTSQLHPTRTSNSIPLAWWTAPPTFVLRSSPQSSTATPQSTPPMLSPCDSVVFSQSLGSPIY